MGDVFFEQIVKKQNGAKEYLRNAGIILAGLLVAGAIFFLLLCAFPYKEHIGMIVFMIFVGVLYYTWYIVSGLNLEYEYIFTNGEMDVDKISNKRKRKRMTTIKMSRVESMKEFDANSFVKIRYEHVYNAAGSMKSSNIWFMEYSNRDGEKCCLIFTPSEKMLAALKQYYRPRVYGV